MKNFKIFFTGLTVAAAMYAAPTMAQAQSLRSVVNVSTVTIPSGFDNSQPTAIVSGLFPNSCYSWDKVEIKSVDSLTQEIRSYANIRQGMCLMVMIPFSEEINLGKLDKGEHILRFLNGDGTFLEKKLTVQ